MANGVTHWGVDGAKNGSNNGATPENENKTIYYYAAGALTLLLAVKLLSSDFFRQAIDFSITYLPFALLLGVAVSNIQKYHKHPENGEAIRKNALLKALYLLLITLLFYILYSPESFVPIGEAISKFSRLSSLENYFLVLSYVCVVIVSLAPIAFFIRVYQKSSGYYKGSLRDSARHLLYSVFFVFVLIFVSSVFTYPSAYAPVTGYVSNVVYSLFLKSDDPVVNDSLAQSRISAIKSAFGKTYTNLTESFSDSSEKLSTTIADTKSSLDTAIARTNKNLKNSLSEDIEARLDVTGGTLAGDLTVEDDLTVDGQSTMGNIIPASDDAYDLGSVTKGWDNIYVHALHGSSRVTIGDTVSGYSDINGTGDLLVSGKFAALGMAYLYGGANLNNEKITYLADPSDPQDAVNLRYYQTNTPVGVFERNLTILSPTNSGDHLDMENGVIMNIGNAGTDFNSGGGLVLAGQLEADSALAHNLGSVTFTNGSVTGITTLNASSTITGGGLSVGSLNGVLKASSGIVSVATGGSDYENPLTFSNSLSRATNTVTLVNDSASPGASKYYGTDSGSNKGWFAISSGYEPAITAGTTGQYWRGDKSWQTLNTSAVSGLGTIATQNSNTVSITGGSITGITDLAVADGGTGASSASSARSNLGLGSIATQDSNSVSISGGSITGITDLAVADGGTGTSNGSITGTSALTMTPAAGNNFNVSLSTTGDFAVNTNQLYVDTSAAFVGIGDTSPDTILDLLSSAAAHTILTLTNTNAGNYNPEMRFELTENTPLFSLGVDDSDSDRFKIAPGASGIAGTSSLMMDSSGIVYINSLQSGAQAFENDAGVVQWVDLPVVSAATSTVESYSAMLDGTAVLTVYGQATTGGTVTDDTVGVGIGTATPGAMLHVYDDKASDYVGEFYNDGNNANRYGLFIQAGADSGGTGTLIQFGDGDGTDVGEITYSGTTTTYSTSSDSRMKNDFGETSRGLDDLMKIKVHDYKFKDEYGDPNTYTGYMAQELYKIYPEAVASYTGDDERMWGVDYGKITPLIVKAVQEQQGQIEENKNNISDITLKTDDSISTLAELQNSVDEQLASIDDQLKTQNGLISTNSTNIDNLETEISAMKTDLQAQITELQTKTNTELNLAQIDLNKTDIALIKQTLGMDMADAGDLSIIGQIAAKKIVVEEAETGKITITVNEDAPTIGEGSIAVGEKSSVIETEAVTKNSKIFITPDQPVKVGVTEINSESDDKSFTIETDEAVAGKDLNVSWWIIEAN